MMAREQKEAIEARFEALVGALLTGHAGNLSPVSAGLLAAAYSGYCSDSHTFSKRLGVEHALVIRECVHLANEMDAIHIEQKNERSQRMVYSLTPVGTRMLEAVA